MDGYRRGRHGRGEREGVSKGGGKAEGRCGVRVPAPENEEGRRPLRPHDYGQEYPGCNGAAVYLAPSAGCAGRRPCALFRGCADSAEAGSGLGLDLSVKLR